MEDKEYMLKSEELKLYYSKRLQEIEKREIMLRNELVGKKSLYEDKNELFQIEQYYKSELKRLGEEKNQVNYQYKVDLESLRASLKN